MKLDSMKLTGLDASGNPLAFDVLLTFESDATGKQYIVYTDDAVDSEGNVQIYASAYTEDGLTHEITLQELETAEEWDEVEKAIDMARDAIFEAVNEPDGD